MLLAGNHDILYILPDRQERAGLDVIIPAIFHKILDGLTRIRTLLHFVKYYGRLPFDQFHFVYDLKTREEIVRVGDVVKQLPHLLATSGKVQYHMAFVLRLYKSSDQSRFTDATRALNQQRRPAHRAGLPLEHLLIQFSLEYHYQSFSTGKNSDNDANPQIYFSKYGSNP